MLQPLWPARRRVDGAPPQCRFSGLYGWHGVAAVPWPVDPETMAIWTSAPLVFSPFAKPARINSVSETRSPRRSRSRRQWTEMEEHQRSRARHEKSAFPTGARLRGTAFASASLRSIQSGMQRFGDDPWDCFMRDVQVDQTLPATVTRVMPYGAFAKVAHGVEGLCM